MVPDPRSTTPSPRSAVVSPPRSGAGSGSTCALAAFRIALGAVLLVDLALRARNLTAFYTDAPAYSPIAARGVVPSRDSRCTRSPVRRGSSGCCSSSPPSPPSRCGRLPDTDRGCGLAGPARVAAGAEPVRAQRRRHAPLAAARGGLAVSPRRALVGGCCPEARRVGRAIPARKQPIYRPPISPPVDRRRRGLRLQRSREAPRRGVARGRGGRDRLPPHVPPRPARGD